ncbi:DUF2975 domain-containing protein [Microbacterium sp. kSW2-24]|uniref:DUF2975 domain-containing protein n=1 Tax=Microbacterium galbinum TaxID=2851646 RepID=UPI001FFCD495|nr:DUF2975 domain-containing protein [Microbacterium galbinum]MCK2023926.1 DUF2975 domain-containing protein [Microbacterium galbinum]
MATRISPRSETADAVTVIFYAVAAVVIVGIATWLRVLTTFREEGIAWSVPIDAMPVDATGDSGAISISGIAEEVVVFAPNVNAVSIAAIIASIALWAAAALLIIGSVILLAGNFLRGRFFVDANVRALVATGWTLVIAPIAIVLFDTMGRNGVLSAIGTGPGEPAHPLEFWSILPIFGIGMAVGLIAVAFRRGIRTQRENESLQKETEGLV